MVATSRSKFVSCRRCANINLGLPCWRWVLPRAVLVRAASRVRLSRRHWPKPKAKPNPPTAPTPVQTALPSQSRTRASSSIRCCANAFLCANICADLVDCLSPPYNGTLAHCRNSRRTPGRLVLGWNAKVGAMPAAARMTFSNIRQSMAGLLFPGTKNSRVALQDQSRKLPVGFRRFLWRDIWQS